MDTQQIIARYYTPGSLSSDILITHSQSVAQKAIAIALKMNLSGPEVEFIREASMLHDIGIFYTSAPEIGCTGNLPYICHGYKGHDLLVEEGFPLHALVCERHTGTGLTPADIEGFNGLLPRRPMEPVSLAEKLIAYCDKFYSKDPGKLTQERTFEEALKGIARFGAEKTNIFMGWHRQFNQ